MRLHHRKDSNALLLTKYYKRPHTHKIFVVDICYFSKHQQSIEIFHQHSRNWYGCSIVGIMRNFKFYSMFCTLIWSKRTRLEPRNAIESGDRFYPPMIDQISNKYMLKRKMISYNNSYQRQTVNKSRTLGNKIVDHTDVVRGLSVADVLNNALYVIVVSYILGGQGSCIRPNNKAVTG